MRVDNIRLETAIEEVSGVPVLKVAGEIDVYTAQDFKSAITEALVSGKSNLVVDLSYAAIDPRVVRR